jgi:hypothetical protein
MVTLAWLLYSFDIFTLGFALIAYLELVIRLGQACHYRPYIESSVRRPRYRVGRALLPPVSAVLPG